MEVRQIKRLEQFPWARRIELIAEGLYLIAQNVGEQLAEAARVHKTAPRAALLLTNLAEEEAGKGFLLIDYLRPARGTPPEAVSAHLGRVYDHLARGIYAEYYGTAPASFGEVVEFVERERLSHYLDGPEGFEWIFRNAIAQRREESMYVDLVAYEDGLRWDSPGARLELSSGLGFFQPPPCRLLCQLKKAGLLAPACLGILRDVWAGRDLSPSTHWQECAAANWTFLERAANSGATISDKVAGSVHWELLFPLTGLDLSRRKVTAAELDKARRRAMDSWTP